MAMMVQKKNEKNTFGYLGGLGHLFIYTSDLHTKKADGVFETSKSEASVSEANMCRVVWVTSLYFVVPHIHDLCIDICIYMLWSLFVFRCDKQSS